MYDNTSSSEIAGIFFFKAFIILHARNFENLHLFYMHWAIYIYHTLYVYVIEKKRSTRTHKKCVVGRKKHIVVPLYY